jgi:hypothetical protein
MSRGRWRSIENKNSEEIRQKADENTLPRGDPTGDDDVDRQQTALCTMTEFDPSATPTVLTLLPQSRRSYGRSKSRNAKSGRCGRVPGALGSGLDAYQPVGM